VNETNGTGAKARMEKWLARRTFQSTNATNFGICEMVRICGTGGTDLGRSLGETRKEKTGNGGIRKEKKKKK
jgi:hypothetical protein